MLLPIIDIMLTSYYLTIWYISPLFKYIDFLINYIYEHIYEYSLFYIKLFLFHFYYCFISYFSFRYIILHLLESNSLILHPYYLPSFISLERGMHFKRFISHQTDSSSLKLKILKCILSDLEFKRRIVLHLNLKY